MTGSCYGLSLQGRGLVIRREGRFLLRVAEDAVTDSGKIRTASSWAAANALDIATYVERPSKPSAFSNDSSAGNGAVICPAFQRGRRPLALMKFAKRVADQSDALKAHCRFSLSRIGNSSLGVIM